MKRGNFGLALTAPVVASYPGPERRSIADARKRASRTSFVITLQARSVNDEVQYEAQVDHLSHSKFVGLREYKNPKSVVKEHRDEA